MRENPFWSFALKRRLSFCVDLRRKSGMETGQNAAERGTKAACNCDLAMSVVLFRMYDVSPG